MITINENGKKRIESRSIREIVEEICEIINTYEENGEDKIIINIYLNN